MENIFLDLTCLPYSPAESIIQGLADLLPSINRYPSGEYRRLREKYAEYSGLREENVIPGNGLDELIDSITRIWGSRVLIPIPTFSQYEIAAGRCGSIIEYNHSLQGKEYRIEYSSGQLSRASLVWICTPNNPTGTLVSRDVIQGILESTSALVAVDECFMEYAGETVADLIDQYDNLLVLRSMSKNFGLAGLRLGFVLGPTNRIRILEKYRQTFNVNSLAEKAGELALDNLDYYKNLWMEVRKTRRYFLKALDTLGIAYMDSRASFVLVQFHDRTEAERVWKFQKEAGIHTFPGWVDEFSSLDGRFIRFNIGTLEEMKRTIDALSLLSGSP